MPQPRATARARVTVAGVLVPGEVLVGPLRRSVSVLEVRDGGGGPVRRLPGVASVEPVELERDVDADRTFAGWAAAAPGDRREVLVEVVDRGVTAVSYRLSGCWPSAYEAAPGVPGRGLRAGVVRETLTLQLDGWVRET